jgi:hypothetical protein
VPEYVGPVHGDGERADACAYTRFPTRAAVVAYAGLSLGVVGLWIAVTAVLDRGATSDR